MERGRRNEDVRRRQSKPGRRPCELYRRESLFSPVHPSSVDVSVSSVSKSILYGDLDLSGRRLPGTKSDGRDSNRSFERENSDVGHGASRMERDASAERYR